MLLKLTHTTELSYDAPITESVMELRMFPREESNQHRLSFSLSLGPYSAVNSYFDWLGNTVHAFTVNPPHNAIKIVATSIVETQPPIAMPETIRDTWPCQPSAEDYRLYDYLQFGGPIVDSPQLNELIKELGARPGIRIGELGQRMIRLINMKFEYQKGITNAASPITEALTHRKGVCQDFTHLMIGLARAMKIPARYVSGLLHPDDNDLDRLRGYTQTHAWCELYFPTEGWIGFDPTNGCLAGENFVKVAVGRDYRDVPPNKGIYRGSAKEEMNVMVTSTVLEDIPPDLFPEKISPMNVPLSSQADVTKRYVGDMGFHQEHQQQQQQERNQQQQQQQQ